MTEKKYASLSATFMRATFKGQLDAVYKEKDNADKVNDFKSALAAGDINWPTEPLTKQQVKKAVEIGLEVPENLIPKTETPEFADAEQPVAEGDNSGEA